MSHFAFTEDQRALQTGVAEFLASACPADAVRHAWEDGWSSKRWQQLVELGVVGMAAPESAGGMGFGDLEACLIAEEAGRVALPEPLLPTAVVVPLLAELGADELLGKVAGGQVAVAVGLPGQDLIAHAATADVVIICNDDGDVTAAPAASLTSIPQAGVDPATPLATIEIVGPTTPLGTNKASVGAVIDREAMLRAATLLGVSRALVQQAADYAKQREQFGQPIGSFQAIKHLLADVVVAIEFAAPAVYRAAYACHHAEESREADAALALRVTARASDLAARTALQVHGAIGYTWECDLQLWMKRAWALATPTP